MTDLSKDFDKDKQAISDNLKTFKAKCVEKQVFAAEILQTLLDSIKALVVRVDNHESAIELVNKEIEELKNISLEIKKDKKEIKSELKEIKQSLCPVLKKNRRLDIAYDLASKFGLLVTVLVVIVLFANDPQVIIDIFLKKMGI